jgi:hypothetical protein
MAGYRRAGAGQFTNATTINDQMDRQRAAYRSRNEARRSSPELGVGHDTSSLFRFDDDNGLDSVFAQSVSTFESLDISQGVGDQNPDFQRQPSLDSLSSRTMFNDLENAIDKPNKKGPNLAVPDINKLQSGAIVPGSEAPQGAENNRSRGFGWEDGRNVEGSGEATIGSYFSRHYNAQNTSQIKPIFGEAKSPLGDTNIDYNQPE